MMLDFNEKKNLFMLLDSDDIKNKENAVIIGMRNLMKPYEISHYACLNGCFLHKDCLHQFEEIYYKLGDYTITVKCEPVEVFNDRFFDTKQKPVTLYLSQKQKNSCIDKFIHTIDLIEDGNIYNSLNRLTIEMIDLFYQECKPEK